MFSSLVQKLESMLVRPDGLERDAAAVTRVDLTEIDRTMPDLGVHYIPFEWHSSGAPRGWKP